MFSKRPNIVWIGVMQRLIVIYVMIGIGHVDGFEYRSIQRCHNPTTIQSRKCKRSPGIEAIELCQKDGRTYNEG